jgi:hypothetical protein
MDCSQVFICMLVCLCMLAFVYVSLYSEYISSIIIIINSAHGQKAAAVHDAGTCRSASVSLRCHFFMSACYDIFIARFV